MLRFQIRRPGVLCSLLCCILLSSWGFATSLAHAQIPGTLTPILPIDQVRIGMKGYGLTVFHGAKVEPFACEVISVMRNFEPQQSVIWIRCPDARMQLSGPVHGMSGSPIYLWSDSEPKELGKGGRLIGAFAFGFGGTKDCYVGVQPIEFMRAVGERALKSGDAKRTSNQAIDNSNSAQQTAELSTASAGDAGAGTPLAQTINQLLTAAQSAHVPASQTWRLQAMANALNHGKSAQTSTSTHAALPPGPVAGGESMMMRLPMSMNCPQLAPLASALFEPLGISPLQTGTPTTTGIAPPGIDGQAIRFEPGSVLAIPLAYGDADISAVGTVTDVLPDGRVLGFGHAMFGQGELGLPMATGFIHMVMPGVMSSFKLGGCAVIRGVVVRDENQGIAGLPNAGFTSSPVNVDITTPGQPVKNFRYHVALNRRVTPMVAAMVCAQSLSAQTNPPADSTARVKVKIVFPGKRELVYSSIVPQPEPPALAMEIATPLMLMAQNPHASVMLESMQVSIEIEPVLRSSTLIRGRLDQAKLEPGDTLRAIVELQGYGQPVQQRRIEMKLPDDLPDGNYNVTLCDAQSYGMMLLASRPHLMTTTSIDDIMQLLKTIFQVRSDALYLVIPLPEEGLAVGRHEMPKLPSSKKALLSVANSTLTTPYNEWIEQITPLDTVPSGSLNFALTVSSTTGVQGDHTGAPPIIAPVQRMPRNK